ncbi:MAG: MBL fold metallo-hydrolase, partial [Acidilobus sp.]
MKDFTKPLTVADGIHWVGVNDRRKVRFENMWPIPEGISYNAYVIDAGDGFIAVDGVEEDYSEEYFSKLRAVVGDLSRVKLIVVNHLEPDHQGTLEELVRRTAAPVAISSIGAKMIDDFYDVPGDRLRPVKDGEVLEVGSRRLRFIYTVCPYALTSLISRYRGRAQG